MEEIFEKCGWKEVKKLTPEEHWLLSDWHMKNWHGLWVRYVAMPSEKGEVNLTIQEVKYGIRNIEWANKNKTEKFHQNHYFNESFELMRTAGPWRNSISESGPEGVTHAASAAATTLYLPDGGAAWASRNVDLDAEGFSVAAELFLKPDDTVRTSLAIFYKGDSFAGVSQIREEARDGADKLQLRRGNDEPFWTYERELPVKRTDVAAELIGTEKLISSQLTLLEREGRFGGYGGPQRGGSDADAFGPALEAEAYEIIRLPDNASVRCPKKLVQGRGFEISGALVTVDGMGASQCKVIYGSDWKLKGTMHGVYFA